LISYANFDLFYTGGNSAYRRARFKLFGEISFVLV